MGAAAIGITEKEDEEQGIHEQDIFYRVVFLLAALTVGLFSRVLGADDAPFRPVMGKRGDAVVEAGAADTGGGASDRGRTTVAALASDPPSRCASAASKHGGDTPWLRST